jgi:hypothetical protein
LDEERSPASQMCCIAMRHTTSLSNRTDRIRGRLSTKLAAMPDYHLAQINVCRLRAPIDDPLVAEISSTPTGRR